MSVSGISTDIPCFFEKWRVGRDGANGTQTGLSQVVHRFSRASCRMRVWSAACLNVCPTAVIIRSFRALRRLRQSILTGVTAVRHLTERARRAWSCRSLDVRRAMEQRRRHEKISSLFSRCNGDGGDGSGDGCSGVEGGCGGRGGVVSVDDGRAEAGLHPQMFPGPLRPTDTFPPPQRAAARRGIRGQTRVESHDVRMCLLIPQRTG